MTTRSYIMTDTEVGARYLAPNSLATSSPVSLFLPVMVTSQFLSIM